MKKLKKQSIVIPLIKPTQILFYKSSIIIVKGPKGVVSCSSFKDMNRYNVIFEQNLLIISLISSNYNEESKLRKLSNLIENLVFGVHFLFSKKLLLVGIGLKAWIKTLKNTQKILLIKAGFSEDLLINIPKSILIFSLRPTIILIRCLSKEKATQFASLVRLHKKPENYKGIGIQYQDERLLLKPGKKN